MAASLGLILHTTSAKVNHHHMELDQVYCAEEFDQHDFAGEFDQMDFAGEFDQMDFLGEFEHWAGVS